MEQVCGYHKTLIGTVNPTKASLWIEVYTFSQIRVGLRAPSSVLLSESVNCHRHPVGLVMFMSSHQLGAKCVVILFSKTSRHVPSICRLKGPRQFPQQSRTGPGKFHGEGSSFSHRNLCSDAFFYEVMMLLTLWLVFFILLENEGKNGCPPKSPNRCSKN